MKSIFQEVCPVSFPQRKERNYVCCFFVELFTEAAVTICHKRENKERRKEETLQSSARYHFNSAEETFEQQYPDIILRNRDSKGCTLESSGEMPYSASLWWRLRAMLGVYRRQPYRLAVTWPLSCLSGCMCPFFDKYPKTGSCSQSLPLFCFILILCLVENPQVLEYPGVSFSQSGSGVLFPPFWYCAVSVPLIASNISLLST